MKTIQLPADAVVYNQDNPYRQTNGENVNSEVAYLGYTLPKNVSPEDFDPARHATIQHFLNPETGEEILVTRPYQSRSFVPTIGQLVNVGWKYVEYNDGSKHLQYFCEACL